MLKQTLLSLIVLVLLINLASAELGLRINEYDPVTDSARIEVQNFGEDDITNVTVTMDDELLGVLFEYLGGNKAQSFNQIITAGDHTFSLTTDQGIEHTETLTFRMSDEEKNEIETEQAEEEADQARKEYLEKIAELEKLQEQEQQKEATESTSETTPEVIETSNLPPPPPTSDTKKTFKIILLIFLIFVLAYYVYFKIKQKQNTLQ